MASVKDHTGKDWTIEFDAFVLEQIRHTLKIDLADLGGNGWAAVENDTDLVRIVAVMADQEFTRDFARKFRGEALDNARAAVVEAAVDFFPPERWSQIQSNLEHSAKVTDATTAAETLGTVMPMLEMVEKFPAEKITQLDSMLHSLTAMSADEKKKLVDDATDENTDSQTLAEVSSVLGLDATPSKPATDSPEPAESVPAA